MRTGSVIYASYPYTLMRCFIAIPYNPGPVIRDIMKTVNEKYGKNAKMAKPEDMHITIEFFDDISEDMAADIWNGLNTKAFINSTVSIMGISHFPEGRKARILVMPVDGNKILDRNQELYQKGRHRWNGRNFRPHLTICRFRSPVYVSDLEKMYEYADIPLAPVQEIVFIKSVLSSEGPIYSIFRKTQLI